MRNWQQTPDGVQLGGDVGGDIQITEAFAVTYRNLKELEEGLYSLITVYFYGVSYKETPDTTKPHDIIGMLEYMVCTDPTDPGGTEKWSGYNEVKISGIKYAALEKTAKRYAEALKPNAVECDGFEWPGKRIEWDGTPMYEHDKTGWLYAL